MITRDIESGRTGLIQNGIGAYTATTCVAGRFRSGSLS